MSNLFTPLIRSVVFRTQNAQRLAEFYQRILGTCSIPDPTGHYDLQLAHPGSGEILINLIESPHATPRPPGAPGLFHIAFLFQDLETWRHAAMKALQSSPQFQGSADHGVSWAVYLKDPDGNGVELAWDKPIEEWPWDGTRVIMKTLALPSKEIFSIPSKTGGLGESSQFCIGHLHIQVSDLKIADKYLKHLGLKVQQDSYPGALFMAKGGYHHHLALNTWGVNASAKLPPNTIGLAGWSLNQPVPSKLPHWVDPLGIHISFEDQSPKLLNSSP